MYSHAPHDESRYTADTICAANHASGDAEGAAGGALTDGLLELKFEPLVVDVMCRNAAAAQALLDAASAAGLRRSGMWAPAVKLNWNRSAAAVAAEPLSVDPNDAASESEAAMSDDAFGMPPPPCGTKLAARNVTCSIGAAYGFNAPLALDGVVVVAGPAAVEVLLQRCNGLFADNARRRDVFTERVLRLA
jgi:tRNA(Phe) wybutosine-synthesizing methylase Tyw3